MNPQPFDDNASDQNLTVSSSQTATSTADVAVTIPVISESFTVGKRTVATGQVNISTTINEHHELVDEPLVRRTVSVTVVPVQAFVEGTIPIARQEGDLYIVPVLEERIVIEKRMFLKEEIHIRTERQIFHDPQTVVLRQSVVSVERTDSGDSI